ncbi:unnamed protein product, partial [marine sediment metagenome]
DLLIQDCTYFDSERKEKYGHASLEDVVKMVEKAGVKRVILTHISRRYRDLEKLRRRLRDYPTFFAFSLLILTLSFSIKL